MLSFKSPFYYMVVALLSGAIVSSVVFNLYQQPHQYKIPVTAIPEGPVSGCSYNLARLDGYKYIRPLMYAEQTCESEAYGPMKAELNHTIEKFKSAGTISG